MNSSPAVSEGFSRNDRLRKRREFEECYASGVRVSGRHVQVFLLPAAGASRPRLGISVPRRVGPAVARNRVRRRLREIFRRGRDHFDRLLLDGAKTPRVMAISIHPYLTGVPHRIKYLEMLYDYILGHDGVVMWTGADILDWYRAQVAAGS